MSSGVSLFLPTKEMDQQSTCEHLMGYCIDKTDKWAATHRA